MIFYTGKGDDGTTSFFGSARRYSKDSPLAWALGAVDEINSFLGIPKSKLQDTHSNILQNIRMIRGEKKEYSIAEIIEQVQQTLFIVQGELAGANMSVSEEKVKEVEAIINAIEKELPPVTTFLVSGATEDSALFDFARTLARRAERSVVSLAENEKPKEFTLAYLNRLSSLLYALARLAAHRAGKSENRPRYK